jgi:hypothetical protein
MPLIHSSLSAYDAAGDIGLRVTVAEYSADEVIRQFLALYNCMDFKVELEDIGISRFQFARRRRALQELRALSIALWGLALQKSFPKDAEDFFQEFLCALPIMFPVVKKRELMEKRINFYVDCLNAKKETDFLPVAEQLAKVLALDTEDMRRLRLKLSLITRHLYTLIFDKLV